MIKYHGTPIGGNAREVVRFLRGRDAIVSYANPQQIDLVAETCDSFILDNGAFTFWKGGKKVNWDKYYRWCYIWGRHPSCTFSIIPDVIDGTEEDNDRLLEDWPEDLRGYPVYHFHESFERLERLIGRYQLVCLGSSGVWRTPGTKDWWDRMRKIMEVVCDNNGIPRCQLHGLRMLDPEIFTSIPLTSADSTNVARNSGITSSRNYKIVNRNVGCEIIAGRIEPCNSPAVWRRERSVLTRLNGDHNWTIGEDITG